MLNYRKYLRKTTLYPITLVMIGIIVLLICPNEIKAETTSDTISTDEVFNAHAAAYFFNRHIEFTREISLLELYLTWLYNSITNEVSKRRKEDPLQTREALSLSELDKKDFSISDEIDNLPFLARYLAWEENYREEFNYKYLQARLIKTRLIKNSNSSQKNRMYQADLESAMASYRYGLYREAILQFDEVFTQYNISATPGVHFYRGESYFALKLYELASLDYHQVISLSSRPSNFNRIALERLILLECSSPNPQVLVDLWEKYENNYGQNQDQDYWNAKETVARNIALNGDLISAKNIFDEIPPSYNNHAQVQLMSAECSLALLDLDDAENRLMNLIKQRIPAKVRDRAVLKLGYICFISGDYDLAIANFNLLRGNSAYKEEADIAAAWAVYKIGAFPKAAALGEKFLNDYPQSQFLYEALSLIGYCNDMTGNDEEAMQKFQVVMTAIDDRQDYYDFNYERKTIQDLSVQITKLEEAIFVNNERDLLPSLLTLKQKQRNLYEAAIVAEGIKTSPKLRQLLEEQLQIYRAYLDYIEFDDTVLETGTPKIKNQFDDSYGLLTEQASLVRSAITFHLKQKTLIQREEQIRFETTNKDSSIAAVSRDLEQTRKLLEETSQVLSHTSGMNVSPELLVDLAGVRTELLIQNDALVRVQSDLKSNQLSVSDNVKSNLDEWSDFAYQQYAYKGLDFDGFFTKRDRINQIDNNIGFINRLLDARRRAADQREALPEELMLASKPGEPPYMAPPVPMWKPNMLKVNELEREWRGEPAIPEEQPIPTETIEESESVPSEQVEPQESETTPPEQTEPEESDATPVEPINNEEDEQ